MSHIVFFKVFLRTLREVAGPVVTQKTWPPLDPFAFDPGAADCQLKSLLHNLQERISRE